MSTVQRLTERYGPGRQAENGNGLWDREGPEGKHLSFCKFCTTCLTVLMHPEVIGVRAASTGKGIPVSVPNFFKELTQLLIWFLRESKVA